MRIFLAGGESRHWIHDSLLEDVKKTRNASLYRRDPRKTERICGRCNSTSPGYGPGGMGGV